jgi:hypothetical protein
MSISDPDNLALISENLRATHRRRESLPVRFLQSRVLTKFDLAAEPPVRTWLKPRSTGVAYLVALNIIPGAVGGANEVLE